MKDNLAEVLAKLKQIQHPLPLSRHPQEVRVIYEPHQLAEAIEAKMSSNSSLLDLVKWRAQRSLSKTNETKDNFVVDLTGVEIDNCHGLANDCVEPADHRGASLRQEPPLRDTRAEAYRHPDVYDTSRSDFKSKASRTEDYTNSSNLPRTDKYASFNPPRLDSSNSTGPNSYMQPYPSRPEPYNAQRNEFPSTRYKTDADYNYPEAGDYSIVSPVKARSFVDPVASKNLQQADDEWASEDFPWTYKLHQLNTDIFGNKSFRQNQREVINAVLSSRDVFVCMPTGGGKSLTFQLPALITPGLTLVIMPLISLIQDQTTLLTNLGIQVRVFSGTQSAGAQNQIYDEVRMDPSIKMLFITPEKLAKSDKLNSFLSELYYANRLERVVIDEAHCVSKWGRDFRSDYLKLCTFRKTFPKVPIIALTATATDKVKEDIVKVLGMNHAIIFLSSFNRPNLIYEIRTKSKGIDEEIAQFIRTKHATASGIIYCISKKDCERIAKLLKRNYGISAKYYHAELKPEKRTKNQEDWMAGSVKVLVATVAFGMGIDKRNVRYVIHYAIPKSLENYYQESGRAGRDGKESDCILFYGYGDKQKQDFFIHNGKSGSRQQENFHELSSIMAYCEDRFTCRRQLQLAHFGEEFDPKNCNKTCDNCKSGRISEIRDMTNEAKAVLSIFDGQRMGLNTVNQIVGFLKGNAVKSEALREASMYGALRQLQKEDIERLMRRMVIEDVLREKSVKTFKKIFNTVVELGPNSYKVKNDSLRISLMFEINPKPVKFPGQHTDTPEPRPNLRLDEGKSWMKKTTTSSKIPQNKNPNTDLKAPALIAPEPMARSRPAEQSNLSNVNPDRLRQLEKLAYSSEPKAGNILTDDLRDELKERLILVRRRVARKTFKPETDVLSELQLSQVCMILPTTPAKMPGFCPEVYTEIKHFLEVNDLAQSNTYSDKPQLPQTYTIQAVATPKKSYFDDFAIDFNRIDFSCLSSNKRPSPPCASEPPRKIAKEGL